MPSGRPEISFSVASTPRTPSWRCASVPCAVRRLQQEVERALDRSRIAIGLEQKLPRTTWPARDRERGRACGCASDRVRRCERVRAAREPGVRARADGRHRQDLERALDQHAERAEGADEELVEVVARDVLHDAAAGVRDGAVAENGRRADEQVPNAAVTGSPETGAVRRDDPRRSSRCPRAVDRAAGIARAREGRRADRRGASPPRRSP
jgi:hypothetical protein